MDERYCKDIYQALLASTDEGFCILEMIVGGSGSANDFEFLEVNPAFEQHTGWANVVGRRARDILPELEQEWFEGFGEVARTGKPVRFERQPWPGSGRWFSVNAFRVGPAENRRVGVLVVDITERRRVAEALEENERQTRLMVENVRDYAMFMTDLEGRISRWNIGAERLLGWSEREIMGKSGAVIFTPEDQARGAPQQEMEKARTTGHAADERWHQKKDGSRFFGRGMVMRVDDERGQLVGFTKVMHDETDRRRAEEALRESEARFRQLADAMPQIVWTAGPDGRASYFNKRLYEYTGLPEGIVDDAGWARTIHPDDHVRVEKAWRESVQNGEPYEIELRMRDVADGVYRWHLVRAVPVRGGGGAVKWFGTTTDIDDQKRVTEELAAARQKAERNAAELEALIEAMPHAVYFGNEQGITRCNHLALEMLGVSSVADLRARMGEVGARFRVSYRESPERAVKAGDLPFARALRGEAASLDMWVANLRDGSRKCVRGTAAPVFENGRIVGAVAVNTNITEQVLSEDAVREARDAAEAANRAKDRFLAVLSHELRTPLTPVAMVVTAMEMDPSLPVAFREDVEMIQRNVELETRLIDDLLDVSRVINGKLRFTRQPTHMHQILRHVLGTVGTELREKGLQVRMDLAARQDLVDGDPARLQQVFWNLLKNAAKFTPEGGRVEVRTRDEGGEIVIEVADTGRGIRAGLLPHIFDPFEQGSDETTRRHGGLGLGLAIAKAVVDFHGGMIQARSAGEGRGATFDVALPVHVNAQPAAALASPEAGEEPARPVRVLLVEDHPDTARTLARLMRLDGFDVRCTYSVASALEVAASWNFDVVVSDIGLPDGSGRDLMEALRRERPVPGIAMSGYGTEEDARRSREAGFSEHLVKPVDLSRLRAAVRRLAREHPGPRD